MALWLFKIAKVLPHYLQLLPHLEVAFTLWITLAILISSPCPSCLTRSLGWPSRSGPTIFPQLFENPATRGSVELNGPALALFIGDIVEGTNRDARDAAYIPQPPNSFDAVLIARCQAEATRAISSYDPRPPLPAAAAVTGRENLQTLRTAHDAAAAACQVLYRSKVGGLQQYPCFAASQQTITTTLADRLTGVASRHAHLVNKREEVARNFVIQKNAALALIEPAAARFSTQYQAMRNAVNPLQHTSGTAAFEQATALLATYPNLQLTTTINGTYRVPVPAVWGVRQAVRPVLKVRNIPEVRANVCTVTSI
jgi:hypothetical protein